MKPSFLWIALALLVAVPAFALATRTDPGELLAKQVENKALRLGDRGESVAALQELLQEQGFSPGPVDGIFGPLTLGAVHAVQKAFGLEADGLAGRFTVAALRDRPLAAAPQSDVDKSLAKANGLVFYQARLVSPEPVAQNRPNPLRRQPVDRTQASLVADEGLGPTHPDTVAPQAEAPLSRLSPGASPVKLCVAGDF